MEKGPWYNRIWGEGEYLDFWSIIHVIDGMLMAGIGIFLGLNLLPILIISSVILLLWEYIEPPEYFYNKILDVVTSLGGVLIFYFLIGNNNFWLIITITMAFLLNFWAWILTKNYKNFMHKTL